MHPKKVKKFSAKMEITFDALAIATYTGVVIGGIISDSANKLSLIIVGGIITFLLFVVSFFIGINSNND
ncbi:hypothetical protein FACS189452_09840 [Bacteroidia bacterium]|nr:hypothetical protein FACS189452_09840 [Bacteroidia bacterium]GHT81857.1 hypothetical protein FACS189467_6560 [Bacteroidia bacterium]